MRKKSDAHLFLAIFITLLIIVSLPAISFGLAYYYNNLPPLDEIIPETQYNLTIINAKDEVEHIDSIDIFIHSVSKHPLKIIIKLNGYNFDFKEDCFIEYSRVENISLKPGHFFEYESGKYVCYTDASVEDVIVEPNPTAEVNLTNFAVLIMLMVAADIFLVKVRKTDEAVMNPWFYIPICLVVTSAWVIGVVSLTRHFLTTDILFCIFGIFF